jgi:putative glutamine amidotransferase
MQNPKNKTRKMKNQIRQVILCIFILSVSVALTEGQVRIAVSKSFPSYEKWIHNADPNAEIVNMYGKPVDSAVLVLYSCQGLLLTGGEDVDPAYFGKQNELSKCEEIDKYRDTLEMALINKALLHRMPVFGICRGEQILNVAMGGTLLTDIPTDVGNSVIHRCPSGSEDCLHTVTIDPGSELHRITGLVGGIVNSFHHQAVDKIAPGMKISARSENNVTEAIEREDPEGRSFVMAVQWHPERLDKNPGLSRPLADAFLMQIERYMQEH